MEILRFLLVISFETKWSITICLLLIYNRLMQWHTTTHRMSELASKLDRAQNREIKEKEKMVTLR